jgi:hypothetical protein
MAITLNHSGRGRWAPPRKGAVLVAVVVVLTISLTLFGLWGRAAVQRHARMRAEHWRVQAVRLAEAGVWRGLARRAQSGEYNQETWRVTADELAASHAGEVRIRIASGTDQAMLRCEATAEFPAGAVRRAKVTKHIEIPVSTMGDQP